MVSSTKKILFSGVATALCTPFSGGEVSLSLFAEMVERQVAGGVGALVVCGTTGEAPTLSNREKRKLITTAVETARGRVPILAGTGSPSAEKMLRHSAEARDCGADGLLVVTPYYNRGTEDGIVRYYDAAASLGLPVMLYNVPTRTGGDLSLSALRRLSQNPNIVAVKEAGGVSKIASILADPQIDLRVYAGNDADTLPALSLGACGVVSVLSNLMPERTVALCRAFFEGRGDDARACHGELYALMRLLFAETSPAPIKHLLAACGICPEEMRLPLAPVSAALGAELSAEYQRICNKNGQDSAKK